MFIYLLKCALGAREETKPRTWWEDSHLSVNLASPFAHFILIQIKGLYRIDLSLSKFHPHACIDTA